MRNLCAKLIQYVPPPPPNPRGGTKIAPQPSLPANLRCGTFVETPTFTQNSLLPRTTLDPPSKTPKNNFWEIVRRFKHRQHGPADVRNNSTNIQKQKNLIPSICAPFCLYNFPRTFFPPPPPPPPLSISSVNPSPTQNSPLP